MRAGGWMRWVTLGVGAALLTGVAGLAFSLRTTAAEPAKAPEKSLADELPRIPAVPLDKALATFTLQQGFTLTLVAHEPQVADPVDACFDEAGRMFVAQMHDYPYSDEPRQQCPEGIGLPEAGVVKLLTDADGDGVYEKSVVFADKLEWPTSVCCYDGGVFCLAAPHLWYLKDTNGDGTADVREKVFSGFSRQNVQGLTNNLKWGLDNHIHFAAGMNGGSLSHRGKEPFNLAAAQIIRFDPKTEKFDVWSGGSQFGHSFDDWGHRFVASNSNHIQQVVLPHPYLVRNPFLPVAAVTRGIAQDGAAAPVFRKSQAEPWRIVRTRRRASDPEFVRRAPPSELVPIGFFTSATGVTIYRGGAYPEEYAGQAFIGDVGGNLVHRKTLAPFGAAFVARRADEKAEFLTSTDNWFRPVNFVNAPDGTLYMLDMYRETIEHPISIPEDIKKHLDLQSGNDRGRIYRLNSPGMQWQAGPKLAGVKSGELVASLESPHGWVRETAQRLLWERQDKSVVPAIQKLALESQNPVGRLHALHTLDGLQGLTPDLLVKALDDPHAGVREHAVELSDGLVNDSPALVERLLKLTNDEVFIVRWQLAFTFGEVKSDAGIDGLLRLARQDLEDADFRTAWLSSVRGKAGRLAGRLLADPELRTQPVIAGLVGQLAEIAGADAESGDAAPLLASVTSTADLPLASQQAVLRSLGEGLGRRGVTLGKFLADPKVPEATRGSADGLLQKAAAISGDAEQPVADRTTAVALLAYADFAKVGDTLEKLLSPQTAPPLQVAAVRALARHADDSVGPRLLAGWGSYSPTVRKEVVEAVLPDAKRLGELLAAVSSGEIKPGELERDKKQLLMNHPTESVRTAARKLFGTEANANRAKVIADYQPALQLTGDAERGKPLFVKNCSVCHQVGDLGKAVGPNLASTQNKSPADLLITILDPNREALPAFTMYTVVTDQGKILNGIIAAESATSITLRRAEGVEDVVLRANIDELKSNGISLMPEGLEKDITPAQMADLIEFVRTIKPAK